MYVTYYYPLNGLQVTATQRTKEIAPVLQNKVGTLTDPKKSRAVTQKAGIWMPWLFYSVEALWFLKDGFISDRGLISKAYKELKH